MAVDVPAAAKSLGICVRTCWDLIRSGELVSFKARRRRLVAIAEIEAYIQRQQAAGRASRVTPPIVVGSSKWQV